MCMNTNVCYLGNCLDILPTLPDNSVDSIVTDPPYELGFMGKKWDSTGIAYNVDMWAECLRVLKPGGHLLAFGGTRTYHRMAVAIEDAGFEVRDMIEWVYGSGFPKSLNIGKAVDKIQGNERQTIRIRTDGNKGGGANTYDDDNYVWDKPFAETKGTSEWEGWGTALKPAHEPICMARKPLAEKTVAENCLKWGTGGINIDESRVGTEERYNAPAGNKAGGNSLNMSRTGMPQDVEGTTATGRFPANLITDGSEEVRECFPDTTVGARKAGQLRHTKEGDLNFTGNTYTLNDYPANSGNASRFFKSIIYQAKASKSERNAGLNVIEDKNKRPQGEAFGDGSAITEHSERKGNFHPTVKPIALMEYLIKMVTPKGGIVLDPFAGSGSTLVAAKQNGYKYIGIELTEEYIPIIEARLNSLTQDKLL